MDLEGDSRIFVEQLRLINAPNSVIEFAIINYYRAYEQRSRWLRENLVKPGEVGKYLARLTDEWNHHRSLQEMNIAGSEEMDSVQLGRKIYSSCQNEGHALSVVISMPSMLLVVLTTSSLIAKKLAGVRISKSSLTQITWGSLERGCKRLFGRGTFTVQPSLCRLSAVYNDSGVQS